MFHPVAVTQTPSVLKLDGIEQQNIYSFKCTLFMYRFVFLSENGLDQYFDGSDIISTTSCGFVYRFIT